MSPSPVLGQGKAADDTSALQKKPQVPPSVRVGCDRRYRTVWRTLTRRFAVPPLPPGEGCGMGRKALRTRP
jgi:hypothetical protein